MDADKQTHVARFGMAASIASAFGASVCCIGPIAAVTLGITSLAPLAKYEPMRPLFGAATVVLLAVAFYATYRRPAERPCEPGSVCEAGGPDRMRRMNRVAVWMATIIAAAVFSFPAWSGWILA